MDDATLRKLSEEQAYLFTRSAKLMLKPHDRWILVDLFMKFGKRILDDNIVNRSTEITDETGELILENDVVQITIDDKVWTGIVKELSGRWYVLFGGTQHTRLDSQFVVIARP